MKKRTSLEELAGTDAERVPQPPTRWLLRFGIPILIIGFAIALLVITAWSALLPARSVRAITVAVRSVEVSAMAQEIHQGSIVQAPGWVEPDPFPTYVAALHEGIVEEILKLEGDPVTKGEVVATLVDERARIRLEEAEAALTLAHSKKETARKILEKAIADQATRSDLIRRVEVANANVERLQAEAAGLDAEIVAAQMASAELIDELNRKAGLVEQGAVAEGVVVRLQTRVEASRARVESLRQQRKATDALAKAALAEVQAATIAHELQVDEAIEVEKARSRLIDNSATINRLESERESAQLAFDRCRVESPVSGVVIELLSAPGSAINYGNGSHGSHILHVYDPKSLQVRADIPLADAARVRVGQEATIVVDVLPDTVFKGEVTRFLHKADIQKNTIEAKIEIKDPSPLLKPEMLARVRIVPSSEPDGHGSMGTVQRVFIPEDAIVSNGGASQVWVIDSLERGKGRAALRTISLGETSSEGWIEVVEGVKPGEKVILDSEGLDPGDYVAVSKEEEV